MVELISYWATASVRVSLMALARPRVLLDAEEYGSCAVLVSTNASPWYQENAPGLIRTLGALLFPVGLVMSKF